MDLKLAAWMVQKEFAENMDDALQYVRAVKEGECPPSLLNVLKKNLDVMMAIGAKVTEENALSFMREKFKDAEKLIAFWEANPKDTNAVFYHRRLAEYKESQ